MSCDHCPRRGLACAGEDVPHLCNLVDEASLGYRPEYLDSLGWDLGPDAGTPPPLPLVVALEATRRGLLNCPEAEPPSCSCEGSAACRRRGSLVTLRDCAECLGLSPPAA